MALNKKTALITGGSKGIGYGIAEALIKKGVSVMITSRKLIAAQQAADRLNQLGGGEAIGIEADVRNMDAQKKAIKVLLDK